MGTGDLALQSHEPTGALRTKGVGGTFKCTDGTVLCGIKRKRPTKAPETERK